MKRDGHSWMRGPFHAGGFQVTKVGDPKGGQDAVNLRTLKKYEMNVLEQATSAADTVVSEAVHNHANILNREIRTKSLKLDPQGTATKDFSMGDQYHIVGLPDPVIETAAVNRRTSNRKILTEVETGNLLGDQKYLRLDGRNQMVSDLQMSDHKLVGLADAVAPTDGVNKKILEAAVNFLRSENERLILTTNENINRKVMFLDGTSLPEANMNFNGQKITNLGQSVEPNDAATKGFVGNILRKRIIHVNPEGAQENLKMNNHIISGLANPTGNQDAVHQFYVD